MVTKLSAAYIFQIFKDSILMYSSNQINFILGKYLGSLAIYQF